MSLLIPVLLIGMALETLSVGMVIPALGILIQESYFDRFPSLVPVFEVLGNPTHADLITLGLLGLALTFALKNGFLIFQVMCQGTFVYGVQREIAVRLFKDYLDRSYRFHLGVNSSALIRNLTTEVNTFCSYFLMPALNLLSEVLVVLAILSFILWIEPAGTICLGIALASITYLFFRSTNKLVGAWGKERLHAEEAKIKYLQQGFGGIKEIIMSGRVPFFVGRFHHPNRVSGLMFKREYIFQYLPKQGVEVLAIFGLTGMCLYLLNENKTSLEIMHILGVMATAGFRLIPSFSRILTNLQSMRFGWASVDVLSKEFSAGSDAHSVKHANSDNKRMPFREGISLRDICFSYSNDSSTLILNNVNLDIRKGQSVGLIGESGSGKTTLANLILGLISPSSGNLVVDDELIDETNLLGWRSLLGYVPQEVYLMDDTLMRNVAFGLNDEEIDEGRVVDVLKMARLENFLENNSDGLQMMLGERGVRISGGQKQRVGIARALYHDPEILVLDEATSALDNHTEAEILNTLKPLIGQKTILIITHRHSSLLDCTNVYEMRDGRLIT
jgi:ABC-type multidrug transport system fused ATPase/permease subunit